MSQTIPVELRELLKKGEFLSMIPKGMKPNMGDLSFVDSSSWKGAFYRLLHGENRRAMVIEINSIIDQFISNMKSYQDTEFYSIIHDTLFRMKTGGLTNLLETYHDHPDTVAELRVVISNIDLQLNKRHLSKK